MDNSTLCRWSRRACCAALMLAVLAPTVLAPQQARADAQWTQSSAVWKAMDACARTAAQKFPDYTRESLAKRDAFRRDCLRRSNLPGGDDAPPSPLPSASR